MTLSVNNYEEKSLQATITLEYADKKTTEAIAKSISPDNYKTPEGLKVKTKQHDCKVITQIDFEGKLPTLTATIDDLLFCTSTAEKALNALKKQKKHNRNSSLHKI